MVRASLPALVFFAAALALPCAGCAAHVQGARGVTDAMPPPDSAEVKDETAPPLPMPPPPSPKPAPPPVEHRASQTARTIGWISLSVGAEAAIVALVTSAVILNNRSARADGCDAQKVCTPGGFGANAQIGSLTGWNAGAWILAIAGAGAGTYLVLTNPPRQNGRTEVGVTTAGTGFALSLRGSFF